MKSKFFNSFFTALCIASTMIACQPKKSEDTASNKDDAFTKKPAAQQLGECELCDETDTYKIELNDALTLICAFHNKVLDSKSNLTNAGGVFSLLEPVNQANKNFTTYPTAQFHWALEDSSKTKLKRLFITYEAVNEVCSDIKKGIKGPKLFTTYADNDIAPLTNKGDTLTKDIALKALLKTFKIKQTHYRAADLKTAEYLLQNFTNDDVLKPLYPCEDVVFNLEKTLTAIGTETKSSQFVYFFGYEVKNDVHKLRLIVAGLDESNQLVFYAADGASLMRETSRPRP
jgi:hypothetical protein